MKLPLIILFSLPLTQRNWIDEDNRFYLGFEGDKVEIIHKGDLEYKGHYIYDEGVMTTGTRYYLIKQLSVDTVEIELLGDEAYRLHPTTYEYYKYQ